MNNIPLHAYNSRYLFVFGTGEAAIKLLNNNSFDNLIGFIDNDISKQGEYFLNKKVFSIDILKSFRSECYIVIASSYYNEIFLQLIELGFEKYKDFNQIIDLDIDYSTTKERIINDVSIGKYTYGYLKHCFKGSLLKSIGSYCSINESVRIGEVNHPLNYVTTHPILYTPKNEILGYEGIPGFIDKENTIDVYSIESNGDIIIQNDVWIGANAVILPNVTLHNGAVIAAGAVVTKDVPPYAIVGGVPAKLIRYRFEEEEIDILQKVKWWEWSEEKIQQNVDLLKNPKLLFDKYRNDDVV